MKLLFCLLSIRLKGNKHNFKSLTLFFPFGWLGGGPLVGSAVELAGDAVDGAVDGVPSAGWVAGPLVGSAVELAGGVGDDDGDGAAVGSMVGFEGGCDTD